MLKPILFTILTFIASTLLMVEGALAASLDVSLPSVPSIIAQAAAETPGPVQPGSKANTSKEQTEEQGQPSTQQSQGDRAVSKAQDAETDKAARQTDKAARRPAPDYNMRKIEAFDEDLYGD